MSEPGSCWGTGLSLIPPHCRPSSYCCGESSVTVEGLSALRRSSKLLLLLPLLSAMLWHRQWQGELAPGFKHGGPARRGERGRLRGRGHHLRVGSDRVGQKQAEGGGTGPAEGPKQPGGAAVPTHIQTSLTTFCFCHMERGFLPASATSAAGAWRCRLLQRGSSYHEG